jgi:SAM-dependent methyltransferase
MNYWNLQAPFYRIGRSLWPISAILRQETELLAQLAQGLPKAPGYGLDLGAGRGHSLKLMPSALIRVAVDRSPAMARRCQQNAPALMVVADAAALPFKPVRFSVVYAIGLAEYLRDLAALFTELSRICSPDASLLLTSSPAGFFTYARMIAGHRLNIHATGELLSIARSQGFILASAVPFYSQHLFHWRKS